MRRKLIFPISSIIFILIAIGIDIDLVAQWGWQQSFWLWKIFTPSDVHHETWILCCLALALGIFLGANFEKFRRVFRKV